jgi:hypothetical protein
MKHKKYKLKITVAVIIILCSIVTLAIVQDKQSKELQWEKEYGVVPGYFLFGVE